jgi:hypothetical protein
MYFASLSSYTPKDKAFFPVGRSVDNFAGFAPKPFNEHEIFARLKWF